MSRNNVIVFCVGRDLLEGAVLDRNAHFLADRLNDLAYRVQTIQVLDDVEEEMVDAIQHALQRKPAFIILAGGMGPGHDDLTREAVAKATDLPLVRNQEAVEMLSTSYRRWYAKGIVDNPDMNEVRSSIADVPEGSTCYENPIGTAPAVRLKVGETTFFLLPGVPQELQRLYELYVAPVLQAEGPGLIKKARHVVWAGGDESALKRIIQEINRRYHGVETRARMITDMGEHSIRISLYSEHSDEEQLESMLREAEADLRARLGLEVGSGEKPSEQSAE